MHYAGRNRKKCRPVGWVEERNPTNPYTTVDQIMQYRRATIPGACYFFTVNIAERNKSLLIDHIDELRGAFKKIKQNHPFIIEAIVILPDHIHTLWQLPENDADFPTRWRLIKSAFSRALPQTERISTSRRKKGERGIWQRRYWEHLIKDDKDFERHVD